ncbi:hypothetical protein CC80DRAFT_326573 [Byssothecium circinans]|uniref:Uncharacterized protein n=1 Tax=Byssothecium circinans TaxID=147558 RepID=A0A6A5U3F0_9PLEO|nr:hypothetical protein CC80DRAFT_326573 [Byssothecium circinans]
MQTININPIRHPHHNPRRQTTMQHQPPENPSPINLPEQPLGILTQLALPAVANIQSIPRARVQTAAVELRTRVHCIEGARGDGESGFVLRREIFGCVFRMGVWRRRRVGAVGEVDGRGAGEEVVGVAELDVGILLLLLFRHGLCRGLATESAPGCCFRRFRGEVHEVHLWHRRCWFPLLLLLAALFDGA